MSRALLINAGLPPCFWEYAVTYSAVMSNIHEDNQIGTSPWLARHNEAFKGKSVPFGAEVFFKAPKTGAESRHKMKFTPRNSGIFLGYELSFGGYFGGNYIVAPIEAFDHKSLFVSRTTHWRVDTIIVDRVVEVEPPIGSHLPVCFPLKERYELANRVSSGRAVELGSHGSERSARWSRSGV